MAPCTLFLGPFHPCFQHAFLTRHCHDFRTMASIYMSHLYTRIGYIRSDGQRGAKGKKEKKGRDTRSFFSCLYMPRTIYTHNNMDKEDTEARGYIKTSGIQFNSIGTLDKLVDVLVVSSHPGYFILFFYFLNSCLKQISHLHLYSHFFIYIKQSRIQKI